MIITEQVTFEYFLDDSVCLEFYCHSEITRPAVEFS
jgi:hypothetical protein